MDYSDDIYRKIKLRKEAEENINYKNNKNSNIDNGKSILNELEENVILINSLWNIDYDFQIRSHRKIIGRLLVFGKKVTRKLLKWYVRDTGIEQNKFNAYIVKAMNSTWDYINELNNINGKMSQEINTVYDNNKDLKREIELIQVKNKNLEIRNKDLEIRNKDLETRNKELDALIKLTEDNINNKIGILEERFNNSLNNYKEDITYLRYRMKYLINNKENSEKNNSNLIDSINSEIKERIIDDEIDYFDFENKFRGSESNVVEKQQIYLQYFNSTNKVILDIGCGRGEFLTMLSQNNIPCKGVDAYPEFVDYCKDKGLDVVLDDAISYLNTLEDNSLGGVFIGQVVEHLETSYVIRLFNLCRQKLCNGGKIIAETQNPETLGIFGDSFYVDPSHKKPIHPLQLTYIAESAGFKKVNRLYLNEFEEKIPYPIGIENDEDVNAAVDRLNKLLYGPRDYSIIGEK